MINFKKMMNLNVFLLFLMIGCSQVYNDIESMKGGIADEHELNPELVSIFDVQDVNGDRFVGYTYNHNKLGLLISRDIKIKKVIGLSIYEVQTG